VSLFDQISIPDPNRAWNHAARFDIRKLLIFQKRMGPGA
jgi:hypothetical protein